MNEVKEDKDEVADTHESVDKRTPKWIQAFRRQSREEAKFVGTFESSPKIKMNFLSSQPSIKEVTTPEIDTGIPNLTPAMSKVEQARRALEASKRLVEEMERQEAERLKMQGLFCYVRKSMLSIFS